MIRLVDLLKEEKAFTATSKETGNVSVFKTKASRDAAIKSGSHEKRKTDKDGAVDVPGGDDKPKVNIFNKDKEEPKSDTTNYTKLTTTPLVKKTKDDKSKINKAVEDILDKADDIVKNGAEDGGKSPRVMFKKLKNYIQGLRDTNEFDDDALNKAYYYANDVGNSYEFGGDENPKDSDEDSIKNSIEKIQNLIKSKKDTTDYSKLTTTPLVKKTKDDITKVNAVVSQFLDKADDIVKNGAEDGGKSPAKVFKKLKDYIQGLRNTNQFDDDALNKAYYYANDVGNSYVYSDEENPKDSDEDSIKNSVKKIQALIKPKKDKEEPKKDSPKSEPSKPRPGNPQVNKSVREKAKDLGITPQKLGKEEYESRMKKAAIEALTDSNFHSEARKLISVLEDKPEWANDPNQDPNKPDIFSPEYKEWEKTSVYSSDLYDSAEGTDEIAHEASNQAGWDGVSALDAIAFDLKMNGSKQLAAKIQSAIEDTNESSTKLGRLLPEGLINEGTRSQVGIIDRSGKIASGYVHFDGYPSNMKPGLKKHMKNEKDVLNLIKKGGATGIYNNKDIKYYNEKPSPIKGDMKTLSRYIKLAGSRGGAEYIYLYNMKDKKWYYADTYEDNELKKLF